MDDYIYRMQMKAFLIRASNNGFRLNIQTFMLVHQNCMLDRFILYFDVIANGRSDEEIDYLARQMKVELLLITGLSDVYIKYKIENGGVEK